MDEYYFSGTLGDAFIVYCKTHTYWKKTGNAIALRRMSAYPEMDDAVSQLYSLAPFAEYQPPCIEISSGGDVPFVLDNDLSRYIGSGWTSMSVVSGQHDPKGFDLDPFPPVAVNQPDFKDKNKFRVGVQLHSGKFGGNFKGFALNYVAAIRQLLPDDQFSMYLMGTGEGYSERDIEKMCTRNSVVNLVSKTSFHEWVAYIKSMDFFITPEGFSAFLAMSQRIRSLVFYTNKLILGSVHPEWRRNNIIMSAGQETISGRLRNRVSRRFFNRDAWLRPISPHQLRSLIDNEVLFVGATR